MDQVKNEVREKIKKFSHNINNDNNYLLPRFEEDEIVNMTINYTPVSSDDME